MRAGQGISGSRWSIGSVRFARDVAASVLAAGIVAVGFSHLSHEPSPPSGLPHGAKNLDRLSWELEEVPTRNTRSFDSVAMFALPRVEPVAWTEGPMRLVALPAAPVKVAQAEREPRKAAILPPSKPPFVVAFAAHPSMPAAAQAEPETRSISVLGWAVPGTDFLPAIVPTAGREVMGRVAALGDSVLGAGRAVAETVGLR